MRKTALFAATALTASLVGACADAPQGEDPEDSVFVDDSKADDFFSASAIEYLLEGTSTVVLDASYATKSQTERDAAAKKLVGLKQIAIAWFVTQYFVDKEDTDENHAFGGFGGMAKDGAFQDLGITARADKLTYDFTFKQIAAGGKSLTSKLPIKIVGGKQTFDLAIGRPTNDQMAQLETNSEWYRQAPYSAWDPSKVADADKETINFAISKDKTSTDGFFDLARLTADGKLDVDVYFGWDYHSDFHLKHSKELMTWLAGQGFSSPVATWDQLTRTANVFKRTVKADTRTVNVEVRIFFGKPGTDTDPDTDAGGKVLEDEARKSLATRDVVMYSGHSGPFYGFALANWRKTTEGDLDDADMRVIDMPSDKYQVILAEGCDTYQIGEAFKENPHKAGKNVDIITTTSFSNAATPATVEDLLSMLLARDTTNRLRPQPVSTLLTKLDSNAANAGFTTMYGMHGIDDDPKLVPFANTAKFGASCTANSDCGGPGNLCVSAAGGKKCTAACTDTSGCGTGYSCKAVASSSTSTIYGKACAKN
jgi:hypothetical protein